MKRKQRTHFILLIFFLSIHSFFLKVSMSGPVLFLRNVPPQGSSKFLLCLVFFFPTLQKVFFPSTLFGQGGVRHRLSSAKKHFPQVMRISAVSVFLLPPRRGRPAAVTL